MFFGGVVSGRLFDTYGPKWLLRVGSVMHFIAFILLPECKTYWQFFLCQGVLFGFAIATMYIPLFVVDSSFFPSMGCMNHWFLKRRAMAIGIMVGGSSLGGLVNFSIELTELLRYGR
jgi:MFS family permease